MLGNRKQKAATKTKEDAGRTNIPPGRGGIFREARSEKCGRSFPTCSAETERGKPFSMFILITGRKYQAIARAMYGSFL